MNSSSSESSSSADAVGYIDYNGNGDPSSTLYDPYVTFSYDKYFCIHSFFVVHMVFNYVVFLSGIVCFITRVVPMRFRFLHAWSGRIYVLAMLWTTAASTAITNTGLPLPTIISFAAVLGGLTIGWVAIVIHKTMTQREAVKIVNDRIQKTLQQQQDSSGPSKAGEEPPSLETMLSEAKIQALNSKNFRQRFVSLKALHGILFFMSWMQIAGRMFASNQSAADFTCHTYPVYKPIDTDEGDYANSQNNLTMVPPENPNYDNLPWANNEVGWSMMIIFGSIIGAMVVGAVWSFVAARLAAKRRNDDAASSEQQHAASSSDGANSNGSADVPNEDVAVVED